MGDSFSSNIPAIFVIQKIVRLPSHIIAMHIRQSSLDTPAYNRQQQ